MGSGGSNGAPWVAWPGRGPGRSSPEDSGPRHLRRVTDSTFRGGSGLNVQDGAGQRRVRAQPLLITRTHPHDVPLWFSSQVPRTPLHGIRFVTLADPRRCPIDVDERLEVSAIRMARKPRLRVFDRKMI